MYGFEALRSLNISPFATCSLSAIFFTFSFAKIIQLIISFSNADFDSFFILSFETFFIAEISRGGCSSDLNIILVKNLTYSYLDILEKLETFQNYSEILLISNFQKIHSLTQYNFYYDEL